MTFIHERPEFGAVLRAAAASSVLQNEALVEKDYWVTHALWSLSRTEIVFWFKGGNVAVQGIPRDESLLGGSGSGRLARKPRRPADCDQLAQ